MKLGKNQKQAALAAAASAIQDPRLKRIGLAWAVVGYRKKEEPGDDPGNIWCGWLLRSVTLTPPQPKHRGSFTISAAGDFYVAHVRFVARTRAKLVEYMERDELAERTP